MVNSLVAFQVLSVEHVKNCLFLTPEHIPLLLFSLLPLSVLQCGIDTVPEGRLELDV